VLPGRLEARELAGRELAPQPAAEAHDVRLVERGPHAHLGAELPAGGGGRRRAPGSAVNGKRQMPGPLSVAGRLQGVLHTLRQSQAADRHRHSRRGKGLACMQRVGSGRGGRPPDRERSEAHKVRDACVGREAAQPVKPQRVHKVVQRDNRFQLIPARPGRARWLATRHGARTGSAAKHRELAQGFGQGLGRCWTGSEQGLRCMAARSESEAQGMMGTSSSGADALKQPSATDSQHCLSAECQRSCGSARMMNWTPPITSISTSDPATVSAQASSSNMRLQHYLWERSWQCCQVHMRTPRRLYQSCCSAPDQAVEDFVVVRNRSGVEAALLRLDAAPLCATTQRFSPVMTCTCATDSHIWIAVRRQYGYLQKPEPEQRMWALASHVACRQTCMPACMLRRTCPDMQAPSIVCSLTE